MLARLFHEADGTILNQFTFPSCNWTHKRCKWFHLIPRHFISVLRGTKLLPSPSNNRIHQTIGKDDAAMKRYFGFFLLCAGFGLLCAGLARSEIMVILKNAAALCLSCLG